MIGNLFETGKRFAFVHNSTHQLFYLECLLNNTFSLIIRDVIDSGAPSFVFERGGEFRADIARFQIST